MPPAAHDVLARGEVLWRQLLDGVLIRVPARDDVAKLEGTGSALWAAVVEPITYADLCRGSRPRSPSVSTWSRPICRRDRRARGQRCADQHPGVVMHDTDAWLMSVAGYGIGPRRIIDAPPGGVGNVLAGVARHKLIGPLAAAVAAGDLAVGEADRAEIARRHEDAMREVLLLEETLLDAIAVLDRHGIDHRLLKGAALAHLVHPDPAERSFGDNDLLIAPAEIDRAVSALLEAGARRLSPPLSADYDRRFAKSVTLGWHHGTELDLHRTLAAGPYGFLVDLAELHAAPADLDLAGRTLRTLPSSGHLIHGALHVALGDVVPRFGNLRDVALLAARPDIDPRRLVDTATRWGCAAPTALGLRAAARLGLPHTAVTEWAEAFRPSRRDQRRLEVYTSRDRRFRRQSLAVLREMSWVDRPAFLRALLTPRPPRTG
ncbi:MAG: nucleotidyltransferase family protein [Acidimicrobiales bacterium]